METTRRDWLISALRLSALPAAAAAPAGYAIHPSRPRLFFRSEPWGPRGLTLSDVRRRCGSFRDPLTVDAAPNPETAPNWAMSYIVSGDERDAKTAIRHMFEGFSDERSWTTTQGDQIEAIAVAYDWLRGTCPAFPRSERSAIEAVLIDGATKAIAALAEQSSIYHTRMYAWANAVLFAGLALYPDRPEAAAFIDFGVRYYKERLIPARRHLGGAWFNALSYGKKYTCRSVFSMLAAWRSATGEDLWAEARERQEDWAGNMLDYLCYTLRPDHRFAGYGDIFNTMWRSDQGTARLLAQAVHETHDPYGQGLLREIRERWEGPVYHRYSRWYQVYEDPSIAARPRSELPLSRLFGRDSIGLTVMRSGWGPADTWALFKCGDYGDNHGHFDQGHFEIFRGSELAMDSNYWAKATERHNTVLVSDPDDPTDKGNQREFSRQVHDTLESYLQDPEVRTGDILDYGEQGGATYVLGDVTPAYERAKVKSFTRLVVFVARRHLVVFDVVTATRARLRRRFLIHYPSAPKISGRTFSWANGEGRLFGRVLAPAEAKIVQVPVSEAGRARNEVVFRKYWPAGRIEVEPARYDSPTTFFLHVLTPCDRGERPPQVEFREGPDSFVVGLAGKILEFSKDGRGFDIRDAGEREARGA